MNQLSEESDSEEESPPEDYDVRIGDAVLPGRANTPQTAQKRTKGKIFRTTKSRKNGEKKAPAIQQEDRKNMERVLLRNKYSF